LKKPPSGLPAALLDAFERGPLLRVITGSRLHGFAHAGSDFDEWIIVPEPRGAEGVSRIRHAFQSIDDEEGTDVTVAGLTTWLHYCSTGVPQALDVMFASNRRGQDPAVILDRLGPLRASFRTNGPVVREHFRAFIKQIALNRAEEQKQRRHAFRLALNLRSIQESGRYNPTLSYDERQWVLDQAASRNGFEERLIAHTGMTFDSEAR
jgi:hypothetical protein